VAQACRVKAWARLLWCLSLLISSLLVWALAIFLLHTLVFVPHPRTSHSASLDQLSPETSVLVLGSSHVMFGIQADRFHLPTVALSAGAMNYESMELVAEQAISRAPNINTILIECDILSLRTDTINKYNGDFSSLYALGVSLWDFPRDIYWKLKQALRESPCFYPIYFMPRLNPRGLIWVRKKSNPKKESVTLSADGQLLGNVHAGNDGYIAVGYHRADMLPDYTKENKKALFRLLQNLESRGIQIVLFRLPHHRTYMEAQPLEWDSQIEQMMAEIQLQFPSIYWRDYMVDTELEDTDFADGHHLNRWGSERFSDQVDSWLADVLPQEGY